MTQMDLQTGWGRRDAGRWREKAAGLILSLLFHGGLVLIAVVSVLLSTPEPEEETHEVVFDEVDLLALGEEIDADALPRLTGDEGQPAPVEEVAPEAEEPEPVAEPEPEPEPEQATDPQTVTVSMSDSFYAPEIIEISPGDTVVWQHDGDLNHTVTARDDGFDSGTMSAEDSFSHTFSGAGRFEYRCIFHTQMTGTVIVG